MKKLISCLANAHFSILNISVTVQKSFYFKVVISKKTHCCLEIEVLVMDALINSLTVEELTAMFLAY